MGINTKNKDKEVYNHNNIVLNNTILLSLEGWTKYVEGFTKGIQSTEMVKASVVFECVNEIMEFMNSFKPQLLNLFNNCENIMQENEELKARITQLEEENKELEDALVMKEESDGEDL